MWHTAAALPSPSASAAASRATPAVRPGAVPRISAPARTAVRGRGEGEPGMTTPEGGATGAVETPGEARADRAAPPRKDAARPRAAAPPTPYGC